MNSLKVLLGNKNIKAGGFYLIGNIFDKAIVFITIPIFTRLMSTSDFGLFNTYMSWVSIFLLFVGLSLGNSLRNAYIDYSNTFEDYISSIICLSFINFLITSTIVILISHLFFESINILLIILCLIQSFMTYIISIILNKYMMTMNYIKRTLLLALPNISITILSIVVLLFMEDNLYLGRILPYVLITSLIGLYYLIKYLFKSNKINVKHWRYALGLSIPLIFHGLSLNILNVSDRVIITYYIGASETGIYSLVYSFSMIALVITTSLGSVWIPWFNNKLQLGDRDTINKVVNIYIEIIVVLIVALLMIGPEVLKFMAPPEYWSGTVLIAPILLASFFIFLYSISVDLEYYYKSTTTIAINTIIAAVINIVLNFIFIPKFGNVAAAATTVVAYGISFVIHYISARKLDSQLFAFQIYIKPILFISLSVGAFYLLLDDEMIRWIITIIGLSLYLVISIKKKTFLKLKS